MFEVWYSVNPSAGLLKYGSGEEREFAVEWLVLYCVFSKHFLFLSLLCLLDVFCWQPALTKPQIHVIVQLCAFNFCLRTS